MAAYAFYGLFEFFASPVINSKLVSASFLQQWGQNEGPEVIVALDAFWGGQLDAHEFEQALGVADGQGSLACCSPWGHKESDMTERLN